MSNNCSRPATVADVAALAGVSTQTVSRVANGVKTVRKDNRERVLAAMRKLNYQPNLAARMLQQPRAGILGVATYNTFVSGQVNILHGITDEARERDQLVTLMNFDENGGETFETIVEKMLAQPVDGVIFVAGWLAVDPPMVDIPPTKKLTVVTALQDIPYSTVGSCPRAYGRHTVEYLIERGHRNIVHLAGPGRSLVAQMRVQGYEDAMAAHGLAFRPVIYGDWTADSGFSAGLELSRQRDVSAVYASNDAMANGLIQALELCGRSVPEDISVIGTDDSLVGFVPNLRLTTVHLGAYEVGRLAVRKTLEAIRTGSDEVFHELVDTTIVERETVRQL